MVTLANAESALKSVYLGTVTDLLNTKVNPLLTKIEQTGVDVWGKEIRRAVSWGINGGIGAGDEDGTLPNASGKNYTQFVSTLKNLYGQIEISDKAIRASGENSGAFTDLLNAELQGLLEASKFNLGRMLYGDGSGLLSEISGDAATWCPVTRVNNLIEGLIVDIYSSANVLTKQGIKIIAVDRENSKIRISGITGTLAAGSKLFVQGSKDKEITGIGALFGTGDLYGVSRTNNAFMTPYTKTAVGVLDEIVIQTAIDKLEMNANSTVDFIACSADVKYAYQDYMAQYKRNVDIMELNGGFKSLSYNGIPLVYDRFVGNGEMYLLNSGSLKLHQLCDWRYLETENGKILRQTQGKPTYTATLVKYCDLICDRPNGQGKLSGITRTI